MRSGLRLGSSSSDRSAQPLEAPLEAPHVAEAGYAAAAESELRGADGWCGAPSPSPRIPPTDSPFCGRDGRLRDFAAAAATAGRSYGDPSASTSSPPEIEITASSGSSSASDPLSSDAASSTDGARASEPLGGTGGGVPPLPSIGSAHERLPAGDEPAGGEPPSSSPLDSFDAFRSLRNDRIRDSPHTERRGFTPSRDSLSMPGQSRANQLLCRFWKSLLFPGDEFR